MDSFVPGGAGPDASTAAGALMTTTSTQLGSSAREVFASMWRNHDPEGYESWITRRALPIASKAFMESFVERLPTIQFRIEINLINYDKLPISLILPQQTTESEAVKKIRWIFPVMTAQFAPEGTKTMLDKDIRTVVMVTMNRTRYDLEHWSAQDQHHDQENAARLSMRIRQNASKHENQLYLDAVAAILVNPVYALQWQEARQLTFSQTLSGAAELEVKSFGILNRPGRHRVEQLYYTFLARFEALQLMSGVSPTFNIVITPEYYHVDALYSEPDRSEYFNVGVSGVTRSHALARGGPEELKHMTLTRDMVYEFKTPKGVVDSTWDDRHPIDAVAVIAKYFMIDMNSLRGTHVSSKECARRVGITEVYTHDNHGYTPFTYKQLVDGAGVLTETGINSLFKRWLKSGDWSIKLDLTPQKNLHPMAMRINRATVTGTAGDYTHTTYWGDTEAEYRDFNYDLEFGVQAKERLQEAMTVIGITFTTLYESLNLIKDLSQVSIDDARVITFFNAVVDLNGLSAGDLTIRAGNKEFNVPDLPQRTIEMPFIPPGYCAWPHILYLRNLIKSDDMRGWPSQLFQRVEIAVEVLPRLAHEIYRITPCSELLSTDMLPWFLVSGQPENDRITALLFHVLNPYFTAAWFQPTAAALGPVVAVDAANDRNLKHRLLRNWKIMHPLRDELEEDFKNLPVSGGGTHEMSLQGYEDALDIVLKVYDAQKIERSRAIEELIAYGRGASDVRSRFEDYFKRYKQTTALGPAFAEKAEGPETTFGWWFARFFAINWHRAQHRQEEVEATLKAAMERSLQTIFYTLIDILKNEELITTQHNMELWTNMLTQIFEFEKSRPLPPPAPAPTTERGAHSYRHMRLVIDRQYLAQQYARQEARKLTRILPNSITIMQEPEMDFHTNPQSSLFAGARFTKSASAARFSSSSSSEVVNLGGALDSGRLTMRERLNHMQKYLTTIGDDVFARAFIALFLTSVQSTRSLYAIVEAGIMPPESAPIGIFMAINCHTSGTIIAEKKSGAVYEYFEMERGSWRNEETERAGSSLAIYSTGDVYAPYTVNVMQNSLVRKILGGWSAMIVNPKGRKSYRLGEWGIYPPAEAKSASVVTMLNGGMFSRKFADEFANPLHLTRNEPFADIAPGLRQIFRFARSDGTPGPAAPGIAYVRWRFNLDNLAKGADVVPPSYASWKEQSRSLYRPASRMTQRVYNAVTGQSDVITGTGHLDDVPVETLHEILTSHIGSADA